MQSFDAYLQSIQQQDPETYETLSAGDPFPLQHRLPSSRPTGREVSIYDAHGMQPNAYAEPMGSAYAPQHDIEGYYTQSFDGAPAGHNMSPPLMDHTHAYEPALPYNMLDDKRRAPSSLRSMLGAIFDRA